MNINLFFKNFVYKCLYARKLTEAIEVYRNILKDSPTDLLACLLAFFKYYELGMFNEMLDMMASVIDAYTPETPGYR